MVPATNYIFQEFNIFDLYHLVSTISGDKNLPPYRHL